VVLFLLLLLLLRALLALLLLWLRRLGDASHLADGRVVMDPRGGLGHLLGGRGLPLLGGHDGLGLVFRVFLEGKHPARSHVRAVQDTSDLRAQVILLGARERRVHDHRRVELASEVLLHRAGGGDGGGTHGGQLDPRLAQLVAHPVPELVAAGAALLGRDGLGIGRSRTRVLRLLRILRVRALEDVVVGVGAEDLAEEPDRLERLLRRELAHRRTQEEGLVL
jgi:hypothetical protein